MKQGKGRALVVTVASTLTLATAFACGTLDDRKVTRSPDEAVNGGETNGPDGTGNKNSGGSDSLGGETNLNPFGGESAGGAPPVLDGPPEVVDVLPKDGADDADPTDVVALKFSEALDDTTVTSDSIKLIDGATELSGKLSYAGVAATLKPLQRLSLLAPYDIQVTQDVTDTGGQKLKAPFASKFTVRDGIWGDQKSVLADEATYAGQQEVASDAAGNAFVVWASRDPMTGTSTGCIGRRYNARAGWEAPVTLSDETENCYSLHLAVSPEGDAIVAWFSGDYPSYVVRARRFTGGSWEAAPLNVDNSAQAIESIADITVAAGAGQALVGWTSYTSTPAYTVYILALAAAPIDGDWPANPAQNDSAYSADPYYDSLGSLASAIDSQGNALVLLGHYSANPDPNSKGVYYLRKQVSGNWQYPAKIPGSLSPDYGPALVSDGDGAMAVWSDRDATTNEYRVLASRYTKAKQFATPVTISDPDLKDAVYLLQPNHQLASNGKSFFTCWRQRVGSSGNAYATRYDIATSKWDTIPNIVSDGVAVVGESTNIGLDAHGNAIMTFDLQQQGTSSPIMWARYTASDNMWSKSEALTADDQVYYTTPYISVGGNGVSALLFQTGRNFGFQAQGSTGGQYRIFQ